jgi:hypothetical protein
LYSILYTQGETTIAAERQPQVPELNLWESETSFSYAELKPVFNALTISGSGRLELIKDAHANGIFKDFRTYSYLINIFDDKNHDLVQYVIDSILPQCNKSISKLIHQNFEFKDTAANVNRLRSLILLDYADLEALVAQIFTQTLPKLQAQAIDYLKQEEKNEGYILELTKDKNKLVREAAFNALAHINSPFSLKALTSAYADIKTKTRSKLKLIVNALKGTKDLPDLEYTIASLNESLEDLKNTPTPQKMDSFSMEIRLLQAKPKDKVLPFIERVLDTYPVLMKTVGYDELTSELTAILSYYETTDVIKIYDKYQLKDFSRDYFLRSIRVEKNSAVVFDLFSKYYNDTIYTNDLYKYAVKSLESGNGIDTRWREIVAANTVKAMEKKNVNLSNRYLELDLQFLHLFEPQDSKYFNELMFTYLASNHSEDIILLILKRDVSGKYERIFDSVAAKAYYISDRLKEELSKFPKIYAPKFRELASKKTSSFESDLLEIADQIEKNK